MFPFRRAKNCSRNFTVIFRPEAIEAIKMALQGYEHRELFDDDHYTKNRTETCLDRFYTLTISAENAKILREEIDRFGDFKKKYEAILDKII